MTLDVFSGLAKYIENKQLNRWAKLFITLTSSFWLSACFVSGASLVAHRPAWEALGAGLVSGTVMAVSIWRRSDLTKGMLLGLPAAESAAEIETRSEERRVGEEGRI